MDMALTLKRSRGEEESVEKFVMANCVDIMNRKESLGRHGLFECKTCKKQFDSFQALGGHRTSHNNKKTKLNDSLPVKSKKHKCSICGAEFAIGQALGGHMTKHRDELNQLKQQKKKLKENSKSGEFAEALPDKKNLQSSERMLLVDLNLTPYENELMTGIILA